MGRNFNVIHLGGGFSCLICGRASYDGYAPNQDANGGWKASVRALPCKACGYDAPAKISVKKFHAFIKFRDRNGGTAMVANHAMFAARLGAVKSS